MMRVLVVDGAPEAAQEALVRHGGTRFGENYVAALTSQAPGLDSFILEAGECHSLPQGMALGDFDGIAWTGSPLSAYEDHPAVHHQRSLARAAFDSGVPVFGSCWGLQIMTAALGGRVQPHPAGFEFGVARQLRLTEQGQAHPMYQAKAPVFDALCVHQDQVTALPPGAIPLATNAHSPVQAVACEDGARSFWGVQYHPEFDLAQMAALLRRSATTLVAGGFVRGEAEARRLADDYDALHHDPARRDLAWRFGLGPDVTDPAVHRAELAAWLRNKVAPRANARGG